MAISACCEMRRAKVIPRSAFLSNAVSACAKIFEGGHLHVYI